MYVKISFSRVECLRHAACVLAFGVVRHVFGQAGLSPHRGECFMLRPHLHRDTQTRSGPLFVFVFCFCFFHFCSSKLQSNICENKGNVLEEVYKNCGFFLVAFQSAGELSASDTFLHSLVGHLYSLACLCFLHCISWVCAGIPMYLYIGCSKENSQGQVLSLMFIFILKRENVSQKANKNVTFYLLLPL